jgi:tetratricopeptide (TPR) repeat protein
MLIAGVLLITFLAYWNSLDGQFVYDDQFQILKNPTLSDISNIPGMLTQSVWQFLNPADKEATGPYYRPLFNIALIINYQLFELNVLGWHLFCVLVHLLVTYLVYRLALEWGLAREAAAAAALLFGLHPVHSESIAWVAALPDPMAAVFILASLLFYERYHKKMESSPALLGLSIAAAFLAMLCKEVSIVFPVFLAAREVIDRADFKSLSARIIKRTGPYFALVIVYLAVRVAVLGFISQSEPTAAGVSSLQVILTIPFVLFAYLRMLFFPYPLAVMYGHTYVESVSDIRFWGATLAMIAVAAITFRLLRASSAGLRSLAFMMLFLIPVLNLKAFRPHESLLHDRYLYLPSIGFCLLAAMGLDWIAARFAERRKQILHGATAALSIAFFILTAFQNLTWQNEVAMTDQAGKVTPNWPFLQNYIGAYHFQQKNYTEAERRYNEALRINPRYFDSLSNIGDLYRLQRKYGEAEQAYLKAIEYGAPYASTHYNLGVVYTEQRRLAEAEGPLKKALDIEPKHRDALYNLGWVYDQQGKVGDAERAYGLALEVDPDYPEARINLAVALTKQQRLKEAYDHLAYVQRIVTPDKPSFSIMLFALGDVYMKTSRYQEAIEQFKKVAAREPSHRIVYTSLGLCYENLGDRDQAKASFQKAIEVAPQDPYTNVAREHLARISAG